MTLEPPADPTPDSPGIPAGWYPYPVTGQVHWWDGTQWTASVQKRPANSVAWVAFSLSIVALLLSFFVIPGLIFAVAGIVCGIAGAVVGGRTKTGQGAAIAGLCISGALVTILTFVIIVVATAPH